MAASFILQYQAATSDQTFIQRVQMGMLQTANNMSTEPTSTANHANRMSLMKTVSSDPATWAPKFALLIASEGIDNTSTDTAIQSQISNSWNAMAGQV